MRGFVLCTFMNPSSFRKVWLTLRYKKTCEKSKNSDIYSCKIILQSSLRNERIRFHFISFQWKSRFFFSPRLFVQASDFSMGNNRVWCEVEGRGGIRERNCMNIPSPFGIFLPSPWSTIPLPPRLLLLLRNSLDWPVSEYHSVHQKGLARHLFHFKIYFVNKYRISGCHRKDSYACEITELANSNEAHAEGWKGRIPFELLWSRTEPFSWKFLSEKSFTEKISSINSGTVSLHLSRNVPLFCHSHDNLLPVVTVLLYKSLQVSHFLLPNRYFHLFISHKKLLKK